jgi:hypothetical protein
LIRAAHHRAFLTCDSIYYRAGAGPKYRNNNAGGVVVNTVNETLKQLHEFSVFLNRAKTLFV